LFLREREKEGGREREMIFLKRFDRGNCNCYGLIVSKSKREGRQDRSRRKPAVPRTNIIPSG
jgi:hypothetical protein